MKSTFVRVMTIVLVLASVISFVACEKGDSYLGVGDSDINAVQPEETEITEETPEIEMTASPSPTTTEKTNKNKLDNYYKTVRYYMSQGYTSDWKVNLVGENEHLVEEYKDQGLALQLVPVNDIEGVQYNVFCNWDKAGLYMTLLPENIFSYVMDESQKIFFNTTNYIDNPRVHYVQGEYREVTYNQIKWKQMDFSFVGDDGKNWKGVLNLINKGTNYYVISYEAREDKYDEYYADFEIMIDDFWRLGWYSTE